MFAVFFSNNAALNQLLYQSTEALKIVNFLWISLVKTPYLNLLHNSTKGNKTIPEKVVSSLPQGLLVLLYEGIVAVQMIGKVLHHISWPLLIILLQQPADAVPVE